MGINRDFLVARVVIAFALSLGLFSLYAENGTTHAQVSKQKGIS